MTSSSVGPAPRAPAWRSARWPRRERTGWGVGATLGAFLGAQLLAVLWAQAVIDARYGDDGLPAVAERPMWVLPVLGVGLWAAYLGGPVLVNHLTGGGPLIDFDLRVSPLQAVGGALVGIGAQLLLLPALYWVLLRVVSGDPGARAEAIVDRADTTFDVALLVLAVVLMAPLAEEFFYRGMLLSALGRRFGPMVAAVASSAVFAVIHPGPILWPGLFVFALVLAALTITTGRIGVAVVAHMAFNATTVVQLLS